MNKEKNSGKAYILAGVIAAFLIGIDQYVKYWAAHSLKSHGAYTFWKDRFELLYLENKGVAWGMFSNHANISLRMVLLAVFTCIILCMIIWAFYKIPANARFLPLKSSLILLASGAVGNMIDRIIHHYVIDFIYVKWIQFPVFNIADIYVTVGAALFLILFVFIYKEEELSFWKVFSNKVTKE